MNFRPFQFCASLLLLLCCLHAFSAQADELPDSSGTLANCSFFRAKKNRIPVYSEAAASAEVLDYLRLGEKVCYIGEVESFAIVDWRKQYLIRKTAASQVPKRAFVRLVDLWEPARYQKEKGGLLATVIRFFSLRGAGVVPEDPFLPFREFLGDTDLSAIKNPNGRPTPVPDN